MSVAIPNASHWGAFTASVENGRIDTITPFRADPDPSPIIYGTPAAVHAKNRILLPHVRQGWLSGDRRDGTLRGQEKFVPVPWDKAIRLVAEEIARVRDDHGPAAIYGGSYGWSSAGRFHHAKTQLQRMLSAAGGYTGSVMSYSYAAAQALLPRVIGDTECLQGPVASWRDVANHAKLMICFGGVPLRNGQIINGGGGVHDMKPLLHQAARAGVRLVNISPSRGDVPADVKCEWIPIRPGTDTALMLAMAYVMITEGRVNQAFLDRYTTGFDRVRAYVLGETDGVAKTPAWAAVETGVPAAAIESLAREASASPTMLTACWSLQRAEHGEQPYWMLITLAAMLGQIGQRGTGFGFGFGSIAGMGSSRTKLPSVGMETLPNPADSFIPVARISDMLERPGEEYDYNGQRRRYPDIRMICWAGGNPFHHHQDLNRFRRAWARAETIVVNEPWWTPVARNADIVLPATTTLERDDIACSARDRFVLAMKQVVQPPGQARNDFDIFADVTDALGVREKFTGQRDTTAWLHHLYGRWRVQCERLGFAPPDFATFWEEGHVEVPVPEQDRVPYEDFIREPGRNRLNTPSGKIELFSATIDSFGYSDCPGHPTWFAPREYLGAQQAEQFPIHLLTAQPATRLHSQMDHVGVSKDSKVSGREPLTMHPADAAKRGIAEGDVVRVFNDRGACLAGVHLSDDLLQGVAVLHTGAWYDPVDGMCIHGNPNTLTQDVGTSRLGQGPSAQSCLVQIEMWREPLPPVRVHDAPEVGSPA
jgi:biotin/methionine sulfoxide reductase